MSSFSFGFRLSFAISDRSLALDEDPRSLLETSTTHMAMSGVAVVSGE